MAKILQFFKSTSLEKRIFLIFFFVAFVFVLILTLIEWQLSSYLIEQYENNRIDKRLTNFRSSLQQYKNEGYKPTEEIISDNQLKTAIINNDKNRIKAEFDKIKKVNQEKYLAIFNLNRVRVAGQSWKFLDTYLPEIFRKITNKSTGLFFVSQRNKNYVIYYSPLFSDQEKRSLYGFVVLSEQFKLKKILNSDIHINYLAFPLNENSLSKLSLSQEENKTFKKKVKSLIQARKSKGIIRVSSKIAYGVMVEYDLKSKSALIFFSRYDRNFNSFVKNSGLLILLVIFSVSLFILTLLANWFGKRIINPIKQISNEMQKISSKPETVVNISGNYQGELGNMVDVFNKMNESLAQYKDSLIQHKHTTENLEAGVFWMDKNYRLTFFNPSFKKILNLRKNEEIYSKSLTDFIRLSEDALRKCKKERVVILNKKIEFQNEQKYVVIIINPIKMFEETTMVGNISDVTEKIEEEEVKEELEMELIKLNKLASIGRRIEGVIHNINSPLNSILGYAQLLIQRGGKSKDLDRIINAARKINSYVKNLQSKLKDDQVSMIHPIDINKLIEQEMEFCQHNLFYKHEVKTFKNLQDDLPFIKAVYGDISSGFTNMFNNAIESLKDSKTKKVWVKTFTKDNFLVIEIQDSGSGIEEKNINKIFDPDFTTKDNELGTGLGLGLAICQRIAEKYNGNIEVKSELGKGSTFTFFIPIS